MQPVLPSLMSSVLEIEHVFPLEQHVEGKCWLSCGIYAGTQSLVAVRDRVSS